MFRTDHLFYERAFSIPHLTKSYFIPAMDLYRKKFLSVIFVYVTDNPGAKVNLRKDKDLVISRSMAKDPLVSTGKPVFLQLHGSFINVHKASPWQLYRL